jgi:hypothetical protein
MKGLEVFLIALLVSATWFANDVALGSEQQETGRTGDDD